MTRRYRPRSMASRQRRYINHLVSRNSYHDVDAGESINVLNPMDIERSIVKEFGSVRTGFHLQFERGEVTSDARGEGSLQSIQNDEE